MFISSCRIGDVGEGCVAQEMLLQNIDYQHISKMKNANMEDQYDFLVGKLRIQVKTGTRCMIPIGNTSNAEGQVGSSYTVESWDFLIAVPLDRETLISKDSYYIVPVQKLRRRGSNVLVKSFNSQNFLQYKNQWDQLRGQGIMCSCEGNMRDMYCPKHKV